MSRASRPESRKASMRRAALMRTAATALIACSPMVYSGAASASVGGVQLAAPTVKATEKASVATSLASIGNLQLTAPKLLAGIEAGTLAAIGNFQLNAQVLQGAQAVSWSTMATQPVQNLLAVPMDAQAGPATISASTFSITPMAVSKQYVDNSSDITVTDAETAIDINADPDSIVVTNSGDLTGGGGINVVTGVFDPLTADTTSTYVYGWTTRSSAPLYDNAGNHVTEPCWWDNNYTCNAYEVTTYTQNKAYLNVAIVDNSDATISIDNSGNVAFSGIYGIRADNQTGSSIDINNSGDVTATSDTERRVGIYANTTAAFPPYAVVDGPNEISPGEYTYNGYGQLTGVVTPGQRETTYTRTVGANDQGSIRIENSGDIDMGAVHRDSPFGYYWAASEGITVIGAGGVNGGIEIVNSGSVKVGDFSRGITAVADGGIYILNSGTVEVGNKSTGIVIGDNGLYGFQIGDDYRHSGDNLIVNTGDIIGGMTHDEAAASDNYYAFGSDIPGFDKTYVVGIRADVRNTNNEYLARNEQFADEQAYYAGIFGEQYFPPHGFENVQNYTTTILNQGDIILKDGGRGIVGSAQYGELRVINGGMISVGDGTGIFDYNVDIVSAGIHLSNFANNGLGDLYAKNEEGGIIVTGDLGVGMRAQNWVGNKATLINEGSITVGNGLVGTDYIANETYTGTYPYDRVFKSIGMEGVNRGAAQAFVGMRNSGDITTGDWSLGMRMYAGSADLYVQGRSAGLAYNEGNITTGDNSIGIQASGTSFQVHNTGTITTGDKDISGYNMHRFTAPSFELSGYGIFASAGVLGYVLNEGQINTGNGTIGIYHGARQNPNHFNYATITSQGEDGIISTGDNSIGMKTHSGIYNTTVNAGAISVGDNSVGIEASAGAHYTQLLDTIQYGGCHRYNYNSGAGCDVNSVTTGYSYDWSYPNDYANYVSGTRTEFTQEVAVPGLVDLTNSGIVETGDNSIGVRVAGIIGLDYEHYHYVSTPNNYGGRYNKRTRKTGTVATDSYVLFRNTGTIRVGANSTAVELTGKGLPNGNGQNLPQMINYGMIDAGQGIAISANAGNDTDSKIYNAGTIIGDILFGDGDDLLLNAQDIDPVTGQVAGTGNIVMDGHTIDMGGGTNSFVMQNGVISVAGGDDNLITGDNLTVQMSYGEIDARDDFIVGTPAQVATMAITPMSHTGTNFSTLTINGDVTGNFRFATDIDSHGNSDALNINGNVLAGSDIGIILNPVEQLKGEIEYRPINIGGTNGADVIDVAGASGLYADSLIDWETNYEAATGDVVINATFGLGHMGTAANAAAISAGNWLAGSLSSYDKRNIQAYTGRNGDGLAVWGYAWQDEGRIKPGSDLQDLGFSQIASGLQAGVQWTQDISGGRVSVSPMVTYGTVEANLIANTASSRSHPWAIGFNANYVMDGGLYVDATYQHMKMDAHLKTPGTITQATGDVDIDGQGFNLEAGYAHKLKSGLVLEPQLQLTHVKVNADDFASSDGIYNLTGIDGKATTVRAGVGVYKVFETSTGSITPTATLSYLNTVSGDTSLASNGVDFDSDTSGSGYKAEFGVMGRHYAWDFAARLAFSDTSATGSIMQPSLNVRYAFGADQSKSEATSAAAELPVVPEAITKLAQNELVAAVPAEAAAAQAQDAQPSEKKEGEQEQAVQSTPEQDAELTAEPAAEEAPAEEGDIVVTGTLIRRATNSETTPISVITEQDIAQKGLMTVGDVMKSFTENKGYTEGKSSNLLGRFTFGAEEVNFRGLGTGRTLVLVNGRRIADYPLPFGGEQNGADLGTIPMSAIAKVEFLASGASATYGSDAVGGVLNIITKRDMEQTSAGLTLGGYQGGFGESGRLSVTTGNSYARGSYTVGLEAAYSGEILASQADYFKDNAPFNAQMITLLENSASGMSSVLPASACEPLGMTFENDSCTQDVTNTISLNPKSGRVSGFFDGRYDLNDDIELFATGMVSLAKSETRSNVLFWQGTVVRDDLSAATFVTRGFTEDELGVSKVKTDQAMWTGVVGARGGIDVGSDVWYWDVGFSYGRYKTKQTSINLKEEGIKNWILAGASSVTDSPDQQYTYIVDAPFYDNQLVDNVIRPVQPSDVDALIGENVMKAKSAAQTLTATLNGEIGDLGFLFKPAKFALRAEYGHQMTEINPDERTLNTTGQGWYGIGAIQANGTRDRWALAGEVNASVFNNLDLTLSTRYDHYSDASDIGGKVTGQAKFLYRPTDWLKVRGGYGQTFRAPDMFNLYGVSEGFTFVPDLSAPGCDGGTGPNCQFYQVAETRQADTGLKEEHGDDLGLGVIFNPVPNLVITADWYRIKLKDLVITESAYDVVLKEYQCNTGVIDANSQLCQDIYSRVDRNNFGVIEHVTVEPINQSNLTRSGIDIRAQYSFESAKLGQFSASVAWSGIMKFDLTRFAGDEPIDLKYGEPGASQPGNSLAASFTWFNPLTTGKAVSAGIFVQRTGRVYNYDHTQFMEPFYDVNLTAGYQMDTRTQLRFSVNNLLNTMPDKNGSGFWPGYWAHLQTSNALGRSFYLSLSKSFN